MRDIEYETRKEAMISESVLAIIEEPETARDVLLMTFSAGQIDGATAALVSIKQYLDMGLTGQQAFDQAWCDLLSVVGEVTDIPVDAGDVQ